MKRVLTIVAVLIVIGVVIGGGLYLVYPVQVGVAAGLARNYLLTLSTPTGTASTESNPEYKAPAAAAVTVADGSQPASDWPSYNRTLTSDRFSPLREIDTTNVSKLKVLCTYEVGDFDAFESGLIMVNGALIGTT